MESVFIDPVLHSRRVEKARLVFLLVLVGAGVLAFWIRWAVGKGDFPLTAPIVATGAGFFFAGLGYYFTKATRNALRSGMWLSVSEQGLVSSTPAGEARFGWDEIMEVQVASRPSRNNGPDIMIRTSRGFLKVQMRWVDRSLALPEPSLLFPGLRFVYPEGREVKLTPGNSTLISALKQYVPPEKFKEGVLISL